MQLGNPSNATADTNNHTHYLIQRAIEALDYNDTYGQPNWASWDLTAGDANGTVNRQDSFAADTNLPPNFHVVGTGDYAHSGYDRGHLCPSADRTDSTNDNDMTFLMDNMMPQAADNNSGVWKNFEDYCRGLAQSTNNYELLITCGPSGFTGAKINTNGYIWIPQYTWKIVVVAPPGTNAVTNRVTSANRVIAIKVPNTNGVSSVWQNFITSANEIQVDTGLTFFTALPAGIAAALRAKVDGQTNPPPIVFNFSPSNGASGTNVVINGTNFSGASTVTFDGTSTSFSVISSTQISATVPANAGSGFISVTTPSGTAISTSNFTVVGGSSSTVVFSGLLAGWDVSALSAYGPSPFAATTNAPSITVAGLTRGSGVKTTGTGAGGGWGGVGFNNLNATAAASANQFASFCVTASNGYAISFGSFSRFDYYRSPTGPTNGVLQFQVGSGAFTDVTNLYYPTASSGASIGAIALSGFATLQNVGANTNVTFRIVNFNGGSSGTWYVYNTAGNTAPDLALQGTITQLAPTIPPGFQSIQFAAGQISLIVTGAVAANYTITATTNLINPQWVTLLTTNSPALPFTFADTNSASFSRRFYRVQTGP